MADEVITNALGGIIMLLIVQGYLIYLRVKMHRGGVITGLERTMFVAMCLISFLAVLVYFVRTQVLRPGCIHAATRRLLVPFQSEQDLPRG
jgi:hypothetical protein